MAPPRSHLSLKGRALRYLSAREHSRAELERKLAPYVQEGDQLQELLNDLQTKGFINEARVVESVLHQKAGRMGAIRLRQELRTKGVDNAAIQEALTQLQNSTSGSEQERAQSLWQRRFGSAPSNPRERLRQMRFLAARGFAADTIRRVVP